MIVDPAVSSTQEIEKLLVGVILPRPIAFVSTISLDGVANLAPFSFFTAVCPKPPVVCFCNSIRARDGSKKDTLRNVEATGEFVVNVVSEPMVSQPNPFGQGTTEVVNKTTVEAQDKPVNRIDLKQGATVEDLVQELQRTGAGARDVISILQAMKQAGALEADLEVL